jgi:methylenetetrahydrofolate dehydrogenase (NADP+) / methenyltetrahydrofolate cyclohydrolase
MLLYGHPLREQIYAELRGEIAELRQVGVRPGLAAVLVGHHPASHLYVESKVKACAELGLESWRFTPPEDATTEDLLRVIGDLNATDDVDGILVQLPLPPQVDAKRVLEAVDPAKDVDGFHPLNLGRLASGRPVLVACTPLGVMEILRRSGIAVEGANAVVIGRSDIVGRPMALLLTNANATVTVCHSKTRHLGEVVRRADLVVAAMGRPGYVAADWVAPGATVIDVGINRITDTELAQKLFAHFPERWEKFRQQGTALVGDVHPDAVQVAGAITPVPGGVGPLTIAMLMHNTVLATRLRRGARAEAQRTVPATVPRAGA